MTFGGWCGMRNVAKLSCLQISSKMTKLILNKVTLLVHLTIGLLTKANKSVLT